MIAVRRVAIGAACGIDGVAGVRLSEMPVGAL
jgi:hypothetical protein